MLCRVFALLLLCWSLAAVAPAQAQVGGAMRAERLAPGETIRLDGRLDHPAWQRAPVFSSFVEKSPELGAAPAQATRVQLLVDDQALYVGITALDNRPELIRAPLVRHDQVNRTQDFVVVYLDPIGSKRAAQFFRVNAAGSLADGMHTAADDSEDFAPDFDWDAAVQRTTEGWTAVLRLPFASLRFSEDPGVTWRAMVARRIPREQFHMATSVLIPREAASFIDAMQPLDNVRLPERHRFLTLRPSLTLRHDDSGTHADASLDVKWRARAELVIDGTLNPDFSQVALDVPQLRGNERFALFLSEKRPFFFESSDLLRTPTEALYTRSLTAPRGGLRATWRGAGLAGTVFGIDDRGGGLVLLPGAYGNGFAEQPASQVLAGRAQADSGVLQGGLLLASRRYAQDRGDNLVLGPDVAWQINEQWRLRAQWLGSRTTALDDGTGQLRRGAAEEGQRRYARLFYNRDRTEANLALDDTTGGFRHDTGFVTQRGVRRVTGWLAQGWEGVPGLNEFWVNTEAWQVTDRQTGEVIEETVRPGIWMTGARNLEAWLEWFGHVRQRLGPGAPLLAERYWHAGFVFTPAPWWTFLEMKADLGRRVDTGTGTVRDGRQFYLWSQLRPLPSLELEPSWNMARLDGEGLPAYRETAAQALVVWHLSPRQHLRAIVQRSTLQRGDVREPPIQTTSLTWSLRRSPGTVFYLGFSRQRDGGAGAREAFVKLQVDADDVLALF
ncbi:MAG: carbohydrate binding family 9 domain-containing protein [Rubrivivax sp.]|nr:carbohydrate binding family 9 domain-containing protein [Rubrivivax sp.]